MYNPSAFQESDHIVLRDAVRSMGVGELVTFGSAGLEATIVPVLIDDDVSRLTAHLARANRQWRNVNVDVAALVTFRGPDAYVSPRYYPSKQDDGKVVPTWNYVTVQIRGRLLIHDDPVWARALVERLTRHHEQNVEKPWSVDDAPADFIDAMVKGIVGIEIEISSIEGKWKLSQNRPEADRAGVHAALQRPGASRKEIETAAAMPGY